MQKTIDRIKELWPIIFFIFGLTVAGAQASTTIQDHTRRIESLERTPLDVAEMKGMMIAQGKQLDRIEGELDRRK